MVRTRGEQPPKAIQECFDLVRIPANTLASKTAWESLLTFHRDPSYEKESTYDSKNEPAISSHVALFVETHWPQIRDTIPSGQNDVLDYQGCTNDHDIAERFKGFKRAFLKLCCEKRDLARKQSNGPEGSSEDEICDPEAMLQPFQSKRAHDSIQGTTKPRAGPDDSDNESSWEPSSERRKRHRGYSSAQKPRRLRTCVSGTAPPTSTESIIVVSNEKLDECSTDNIPLRPQAPKVTPSFESPSREALRDGAQSRDPRRMAIKSGKTPSRTAPLASIQQGREQTSSLQEKSRPSDHLERNSPQGMKTNKRSADAHTEPSISTDSSAARTPSPKRQKVNDNRVPSPRNGVPDIHAASTDVQPPSALIARSGAALGSSTPTSANVQTPAREVSASSQQAAGPLANDSPLPSAQSSTGKGFRFSIKIGRLNQDKQFSCLHQDNIMLEGKFNELYKRMQDEDEASCLYLEPYEHSNFEQVFALEITPDRFQRFRAYVQKAIRDLRLELMKTFEKTKIIGAAPTEFKFLLKTIPIEFD